MRIAFVLVLLTLSACGADGAPDRPTPGVTVSGEASMGVTSGGASQ